MLRMAIVVLTSVMGAAGCSSMPADMRGPDGALAPCSAKRCVSSEESNPDYRIDPFYYTAMTPTAAQQALSTLVEKMEGAEVVEDQPGYLHAVFTSSLMRYRDDLELVFTTPNIVQVRSSSRIGYYDFKVNRNRIETLRESFARIQP